MFISLGAIRQNRERAALYFDFVQHKSGSRSALLVVDIRAAREVCHSLFGVREKECKFRKDQLQSAPSIAVLVWKKLDGEGVDRRFLLWKIDKK